MVNSVTQRGPHRSRFSPLESFDPESLGPLLGPEFRDAFKNFAKDPADYSRCFERGLSEEERQPRTPSDFDFRAFRIMRQRLGDRSPLFRREELYQPTVDLSFSNPYEPAHAALDRLSTSKADAGLEAFAAVPHEIRTATGIFHRAVGACIGLLFNGRFSDAARLARIIGLTDSEREHLASYELGHRGVKHFTMETPEKPEPDICAALQIAPSRLESVWLKGYEMALADPDTYSFGDVIQQFSQKLPPKVRRSVELAALQAQIGGKHSHDYRRFEKVTNEDSTASIVAVLAHSSALTRKDRKDTRLVAYAETEVLARLQAEPPKTNLACRLVTNCELSSGFRKRKEVQAAALKALEHSLRGGESAQALEMSSILQVPKTSMQTDEIQAAARQGALALVSAGNLTSLLILRAAAILPAEFWVSPDYQSRALVGLKNFIESTDREEEKVNRFVAEAGISKETMRSASKGGLFVDLALKRALAGHANCLLYLLRELVPDEKRVELAAIAFGKLIRSQYKHDIVEALSVEFLQHEPLGQHLAKLQPTFELLAQELSSPTFAHLAAATRTADLIKDQVIGVTDVPVSEFNEKERRAIGAWALGGRVSDGYNNVSDKDINGIAAAAGVINPENILQFTERALFFAAARTQAQTHGIKRFAEALPPERRVKATLEGLVYQLDFIHRKAPGPEPSIHSVLALLKEMPLTPEAAQDTRIQGPGGQIASAALSLPATSWSGVCLTEALHLSAEFRAQETVISGAKKALVDALGENDLDRVIKIVEVMRLTEDAKSDPLVVDAAKDCALRAAHVASAERLGRLRGVFPITASFWESTAKVALLSALGQSNLYAVAQIVEVLQLSEDAKSDPVILAAAQDCALQAARAASSDTLKRLRSELPIAASFWEGDAYQSAALKGVPELFQMGFTHRHAAAEALDTLSLTEKTIRTGAAQAVFLKSLRDATGNGHTAILGPVLDKLVNSANRQQAAAASVGSLIDRHPLHPTAVELVRDILPQQPLENHLSDFPERVRLLAQRFELKDFHALLEVFVRNPDFHAYFVKTKPEDFHLDALQIAHAKLLHLTLVETNQLLSAGVDLGSLAREGDFSSLAEALHKHAPEWSDEANIWATFTTGAAVFGYERMFEYLDYRNQTAARGANRHDALQGFRDVVRLRERLGVEPAPFFHQILDKVRRDGGEYTAGSSYQLLMQIARQFPEDSSKIMAEAAKFQQHSQVAELLAELAGPRAPARSWRHLKNFARLQRIVQQKDLMPLLDKLQKSDPRAHHFISLLGLHPESNADIDKVLLYAKDPDAFLALPDAHTPEVVHRHLKPSAYTKIKNLDLSGQDLQRAHLGGILDQIQRIRPLEMRLRLPADPTLYPTTRAALHSALGSRKFNIPGKAAKPGSVFLAVKNLLPGDMTVGQYLEGASVDQVVEQQISQVLFDPQIGLPIDTVELVAAIHPKSSPEGLLAGNQTVDCTQYGAGKANVYTFHLGTASFTLQLTKQDGGRRAIVQSVMRLDQDIGAPFSALTKMVASGNSNLSTTLPDTVLRQSGRYILAADNRQAAGNYRQQPYVALGDAAYQIFFREYIRRYGGQLGLAQEKLPIGKGFSATSQHLPSEKNHEAPVSPIGYSDMTADEVFVLNLKDPVPPYTVEITALDEVSPEIKLSPQTGVRDLSFMDTMAVDYLEGLVYRNSELPLTLLNQAPMLMAVDINNAHKERPTLGIKYVEPDGFMSGYLVAWEGKTEAGQEIIYIEDLAVHPQHRGVGYKLLREFLERYNRHYLKQGRFVPILLEARDATTFRFVKASAARLASHYGVELKISELRTRAVGLDIMHDMLLEPGKLESK